MFGLIIGIIVFACVLLILIVLVQNPKGGGLASGFSASNQFMGVKRTADFIEKTTWGLAAAVIVLSIVATLMPRGTDEIEGRQSRIQEQIDEHTAADPGTNIPAYPTAPAQPDQGQQQGTEQPQPVK
jgi:preprotein translocase subunit SecG